MNIDHLLNMERFQRQLHSELDAALKQNPYQITLNEFFVLYFLKETAGNSLTISELSDKTGLSISATSRMLARFEQTCSVIERQEGDDKRAVEIIITPDGEEYLAHNLAQIENVLKQYETLLSNF